jgi:hypothetical protein
MRRLRTILRRTLGYESGKGACMAFAELLERG